MIYFRVIEAVFLSNRKLPCQNDDSLDGKYSQIILKTLNDLFFVFLLFYFRSPACKFTI